jgi:hypothetical protein
MSKRRPKGWSIKSGLEKTALGIYPQMVTAKALRAIKPHFTHYVDCEEPNKAFAFVSRFNGQPCPLVMADGNFKWSTGYYPCPEAHGMAFELLEPVIEKMIAASPASL